MYVIFTLKMFVPLCLLVVSITYRQTNESYELILVHNDYSTFVSIYLCSFIGIKIHIIIDNNMPFTLE